MNRVFIIGPGGVGKTTCGKLFANLIGYAFVDLDDEFILRIGSICEHNKTHGYLSYCRKNSDLFYALLDEQKSDTVFALSAGFLVYEDVEPELSKHKDTIRKLGVSILLLPSKSAEETETIVVARQLSRGFNINMSEWRHRMVIQDRFPRYLEQGDIKIFSVEKPVCVAEEMRNKYFEYMEQRTSLDIAPLQPEIIH